MLNYFGDYDIKYQIILKKNYYLKKIIFIKDLYYCNINFHGYKIEQTIG